MSVIENFLVNTSTFDSIIQALINDKDVPSKINDTYFKSLGFQNPSDLLVIHLLKGLNILEEDGSTNDRFTELMNPSSTRTAIAKGVVEAYEGLFRMEPQIHKMQHDELQKIFSEVFAGQKSELIFRYMANTFSKLLVFAGGSNIEQALKGDKKPTEELEQAVKEQEVTETQESGPATNGVHKANGSHNNGQNGLNGHTKDTPNPEILETTSEAPKEEKGDISFEDLVGLNSSKPEPEAQQPSQNGNTEDTDYTDLNQDILGSSGINGHTPQGNGDNGTARNHFPDENKPNLIENNPFPAESQSADGIQADKPEDYKKQTVTNIPADTIPTVPEETSRLQNDQKLQKALIKKADLLYKLERYESLLPALDQIISYFDRANEPFLKEAVATAVIRRAFVLYNLKKYDQALPALDRVIARFSYSDHKSLYEQASYAMLYKAKILEETDQPEQVLPLFNSIIERLGHTDNPDLKNEIDGIFLKRLDILLAAGRKDEVVAAADQLIERFKHNDEKLQYLEEAMFKKAEILENMNKHEEALEAYSDFLEKFGQNISVS